MDLYDGSPSPPTAGLDGTASSGTCTSRNACGRAAEEEQGGGQSQRGGRDVESWRRRSGSSGGTFIVLDDLDDDDDGDEDEDEDEEDVASPLREVIDLIVGGRDGPLSRSPPCIQRSTAPPTIIHVVDTINTIAPATTSSPSRERNSLVWPNTADTADEVIGRLADKFPWPSVGASDSDSVSPSHHEGVGKEGSLNQVRKDEDNPGRVWKKTLIERGGRWLICLSAWSNFSEVE
jgi:hypothetical protein